MRVLALDTTTPSGSVALVEDLRVVAEHVGDVTRSHAERLPGGVLRVLQQAAVPMTAIDLFAVTMGPGSFTGLRIGIATIQGLAFVNHRRVVALSSLEALAHAGAADQAEGTLVAAWMDAHRHDVFSALYRVRSAEGAPEEIEEIEAPSVGRPADVLERWH